LSVYRSIVKQSGTYGLSIMAGRLFSILLLPVYTRYLRPADYGVIELLDVTITVVGALIGVRLGDSLFYFYADASTDAGRKSVASTTMLAAFLLGIGGIGILGGALLSTPASRVMFGSPDYAPLFRLAFLNLGLGMVVDTGLSYFRALGQAGRYAWITTVRTLLMAALNVTLLAAARMGVRGFLWGTAIGTILTIVYIVGYILARTGLHFDGALLRRELRYAAPLMLSSLAIMLLHSGDRFFLRHYVSLAEIGIYAFAYKLGTTVSTLQTAFSLYWSAQLFHILKRPDGERICVRLMTYLTGGLLGMGLVLCLFIDPILRIMAAPDFRSAGQYVPVIVLAYVVRAIGDHARGIFSLSNQPGKHLHVALVGAAACMGAYAVLIPRFHLWGAAAATLAGFAVMTCAAVYWAQRVRRYDYEYGRMTRLFVYSAAAVAAMASLHPQGFWTQVAAGSMVLVLWPAAVLFTGLLAPEERDELSRSAASLWSTALRRTAS
jgi:O-antigen/teichoic acid export membrane protein